MTDSANNLTHFGLSGARMVDVAAKPISERVAVAESFVSMQPTTLRRILDRDLAKGDVFEVARLAGIMATKRTGDLIPLCHPIGIDGVELALAPIDETRVRIEATVRCVGRTGVEMEALTAVSIAGLTIYDMCKAIDRGMELGPTRLIAKRGGRSGEWTRSSPPSPVSHGLM